MINYTYTYDEVGNIKIVEENKEEIVTYEYDKASRLVKEHNKKLNFTKTYIYDEIGNIQTIKEYEYKNEAVLRNTTYNTYDSLGRIIEHNGKTITYDANHNPTTYGEAIIRFDKVKNLKQYNEITYTYDTNGIRREKTTNHITTTYITIDNQIIEEKNENNTLHYYYGINGIVGFTYNGEEYTYIKDVTNTIIGILDKEGTVVARYQYDAWGKHIVIDQTNKENTNKTFIGNINPFRYKGYYYDVETGLFYCNSRYYSPELCRWISPDSIEYLDPSSINGLNLYCYCMNNPIMYVDPSGHEWYNPLTWDWGEIAKGVGLVITGVVAIAVGVVTLPYGGWISAVAGVTILAGGGTALFGLSDIGEGITDYNVIQEAVFMGNEDAYNLAENIFQYTAIAGTAICGIYGATHTTLSAARSTPRTGNAHSSVYNKQFNTLTYYGKNGQMKYSMHLFNRGHQWVHWHTELPHSQPINNFLRFVWEMAKKGF